MTDPFVPDEEKLEHAAGMVAAVLSDIIFFKPVDGAIRGPDEMPHYATMASLKGYFGDDFPINDDYFAVARAAGEKASAVYAMDHRKMSFYPGTRAAVIAYAEIQAASIHAG